MEVMRAIARNTTAWLLGTFAVAAVPALEVFAAAPKSKGGAPVIDKTLAFWPLLVTVVALLGICVVAFKNARRTHAH